MEFSPNCIKFFNAHTPGGQKRTELVGLFHLFRFQQQLVHTDDRFCTLFTTSANSGTNRQSQETEFKLGVASDGPDHYGNTCRLMAQTHECVADYICLTKEMYTMMWRAKNSKKEF